MKYTRNLLVLTLMLASAATATAQGFKRDPLSKDDLRTSPKVLHAFHDVVAKPAESAVRVVCDGTDTALGAVVGADGWIITKASDLKGKIKCKLKDGKEFEAKLVGVDDANDLAMLKIDAKDLPVIQWRDSTNAKVGQWVASVGVGADPTTIGVISVATRKFKPGDQPPKNSNADGGYLGVGLEESSEGAKISSIAPKSPAQKADLRVNDIVREAAGRKIIDNESLINTIQRLKPGDIVTFKIKRGNEELQLKATLTKRPKGFAGNPQELMGSKLSNRRGGFPTILQHDSVLKPSDCGGPLVDLDGKTVGINISRAGRTESYAIPAEVVQSLIADLQSGKLAPKTEEELKVESIVKAKDAAIILRTTTSLNDKDKVEKHRPGGQFMKVHEVKLSKDVAYTIAMDSIDFDAFLIIEDAAGKKLAEDDDSGGDQNARIEFVAPSDGTYRIIATSFEPKKTGNYTLTVRKK